MQHEGHFAYFDGDKAVGYGEKLRTDEKTIRNGREVVVSQIITSFMGQKSDDALPIDKTLFDKLKDPNDPVDVTKLKKKAGSVTL